MKNDCWFEVMLRGKQTACIPPLLSPLLTRLHCQEFPVFILLFQGMFSGRVKHPDRPWMRVLRELALQLATLKALGSIFIS